MVNRGGEPAKIALGLLKLTVPRGGHVLAGLCELQQRPFPPLLRAADRYMAAKVARRLHADARRPVPPSLQGEVAEVRHQLRWHRRDDGPRS